MTGLNRPENKRFLNPKTGTMALEWIAYFSRLEAMLAAVSGGTVASFEGRTGLVVSAAGDYTATEITNAPAGNIVATTVQAAINELDTEKQPIDSDLTALAALSSTGHVVRTAAATYALRALTGPAAGISVTNGDGVAGNPTLALANDLAALEGLASTGIAVRTATDTWAQRTLTGPAAGISVSNGDGVSGNPTLALANDLSALEGLASTGLAVRTATDTWAQRTITGTTDEISVANGDGVAGNPTLSLPSRVDLGGKTLEIPNSAAPTVDANGEIAIDTTITDFSAGLIKYFSGEEMAVVAMPVAQLTAPTDGYVVTYNATDDEFQLAAVSGGGGGPTVTAAQATTSGTTFDFTGLPSDVSRIFVNLNGVSLSGTDHIIIQIGDAGGIETTGYTSTTGSNGGAEGTSTAGFIVGAGAAAGLQTGMVVLSKISTTEWIATHNVVREGTDVVTGAGRKTLSAGPLDRVRIAATGANTFDAGNANIIYD